MKRLLLSLLAAVILFTGCATTQTTQAGVVGVQRRQFMLLSEKQVESMSAESYLATLQEAGKNKTLNTDAQQLQRVRTLANRLIVPTVTFRPDAASWKWEINVQDSEEVNAYCMPGGKIMVFKGLISKLKATDDELAAVMGHEIAHALREHGRERMSEAYVQQIGMFGLAALVGATAKDEQKAAATMEIASLVTTIGLTLPHSREQEREADRMGLELAARAGYDPQAAVSLWRKMTAAGGAKQAEFLSTHPSGESRISDLQGLIPTVLPLYEEAKRRP